MNEPNATNELEQILESLLANGQLQRESVFRLYNDTDSVTVLKILAHFRANLTDGIPVLRAGILESNSDVIWKTAHKFAGSAELIGFMKFGRLARQINDDFKVGVSAAEGYKAAGYFVEQADLLAKQIDAAVPNLSSYLS